MELWKSIPFACVMLPLGSAAVTSVLRTKAARLWCALVLLCEVGLSAFFLVRMAGYGQSYAYPMGHYSAPWGNELRAGLLEAAIALVFAVIMLLSLLGGARRLDDQLLPDKRGLYFVMLLLMTASLMAQIYTNDIFTAYVFVEIMTISAAALIASRAEGRTLVAAARYMIMNLIGSALFLLGIILLYDLTGHLLMPNLRAAVAELHRSGRLELPLTVVVALLSAGLAVKSALFPFHTWVIDAYGHSTRTSQAILSALVSKGYILLLLKVMVRVIGLDVIRDMHVGHVLLGFGAAGMIMGSVEAIREKDIRRMVAWSSVAQIGYIYAGLGLATEAGITAAVYQLLQHALCKSMLFIAVGGLCDGSAGSDFRSLRGAALRRPLAGAAFTLGALSMVGIPLLGGFTAKYTLAQAAIARSAPVCWGVLAVLVLSTVLNVAYFLRTVITLWRQPEEGISVEGRRLGPAAAVALAGFILCNLAVGLGSRTVLQALRAGLDVFS